MVGVSMEGQDCPACGAKGRDGWFEVNFKGDIVWGQCHNTESNRTVPIGYEKICRALPPEMDEECGLQFCPDCIWSDEHSMMYVFGGEAESCGGCGLLATYPF